MKLYTLDEQFIKKVGCIPDNFTGIVNWDDKLKEWRLNGLLHRLNGPARVWFNGTKSWWINGTLHRLEGPAIEWDNGYKEYWIDNHKCNKEQHTLLVDIMKLKELL